MTNYARYIQRFTACLRVVKQIFVSPMVIREVHLFRGKKIALSFDDGYDYTAEILEKLEKHGVKATFFAVGDWIEKEPETFRKIFENGHEIGNHGFSHTNMLELTDEEVCEEIECVERLAERIIGERIRLFRFPYGKYNEHLVKVVKKKGLVPVGWSVDSEDWTGVKEEKIYDNIMENEELSGKIILLHTMHCQTAAALDLIIPALKRGGYEIIKVSDLMKQCIAYRYKLSDHNLFR